jgi:acetyltransferase
VAARALAERLAELNPSARLAGYCVQTMEHRPHAYELIVGVAVDPTFGPVILFGQGGTAVEVISDRAVALPPLNMPSRELVSHTRIYKPEATAAFLLTWTRFASPDPGDQLIIDIRNRGTGQPAYRGRGRVVVLDARVVVTPGQAGCSALRFGLSNSWRDRLSRVGLCSCDRSAPDEPAYHAFLTGSARGRPFRYFGLVRDFPFPARRAKWTTTERWPL